MKVRYFVLLIFLLLGGFPASARADQANRALTLLHTNDLHAHLNPFYKEAQDCHEAHPDCLGGFARLKALIDTTRKEAPDMVLLDAGDRFSGTLFYTLRKGEDIARLMQPMGYDAMALGNHEFDDGLPELQRFSKKVPAPLLAANVVFPKESPLAEHVVPALILEKGGVRFGIIGLLSEDTKTECDGAEEIDILSPIETARQEVHRLTEKGVDIIVALTHIGLENDKKLAQAVPEIDVIIGGHSHHLLSDNPLDKTADGPYPLVIPQQNGATTLIATVGLGGQHVGRLDLRFDDKGRLTSFQGASIPLDHRVGEDEKTAADIRALETDLADILNHPLMTSETEIGLSPAPKKAFCSEECYVGEVLTDILLEAGQADKVDIALINAGGIRSRLPAGQITFRHVVQAYPFTSYGALVEMSGQALQDYLAHGLQKYTPDERTNAFLQIAGAGYVFDDKTHRITHLTLPNGTAIDPDKTYRIILPSFLAKGGDGFPPQPILKTYSESIRDLIVSYLKTHAEPPHPFMRRIQRQDASTLGLQKKSNLLKYPL